LSWQKRSHLNNGLKKQTENTYSSESNEITLKRKKDKDDARERGRKTDEWMEI